MSPPTLTLLTLLTLLPAATLCSAARLGHNAAPHGEDLVRSSCSHALYPDICLRTLSSYAGPTDNPRDVARAALKISLARARRVSSYLSDQAASSGSKSKRERGALADCLEQMSDSVDELRESLAELKHLRGGEELRWQLSNAETWVSAALTNEDTCLDGFQEVGVKVKDDVRRKISNVARVTSNALYLINRLDEGTSRRQSGRGRRPSRTAGFVMAGDDGRL
ncbi:PMEI domain-containing protein [Psidium guajava]|nr:PMEI domain-containing protein [Psidium guajava]